MRAINGLHPVENDNFLRVYYDLPFNRKIQCDIRGCGCRTNSFVWVSHLLKAIYFQVPKAACTSVMNALNILPGYLYHKMRAAAVAQLRERATIRFRRRGWPPHPNLDRLKNILREERTLCDSSISCVRTHGMYQFLMFDGTPDQALKQYPHYFTFAVVRDPLERLLSNYKMFIHSGIPKRNQQAQFHFGKAQLDFQQFVSKIVERHNHHWSPFADFLPQDPIDLVVEAENLATKWPLIRHRLGVSAEVGVKNATRPMGIGVDQSTRQQIRSHFARDYQYIEQLKKL